MNLKAVGALEGTREHVGKGGWIDVVYCIFK